MLDPTYPIFWASPYFSLRRDAEAAMSKSHVEPLPLPWEREAAFTRLLLKDSAPNGAARFHKPDLWHTFHLGVGKSWVASSLLLLSIVFAGNSIDAHFDKMNQEFLSWARAEKEYKFISKVDKFLCGGGGSNEAIGSWSKAAVTTLLCLFLEHLCKMHPVLVHADECLRLIATFLSLV